MAEPVFLVDVDVRNRVEEFTTYQTGNCVQVVTDVLFDIVPVKVLTTFARTVDTDVVKAVNCPDDKIEFQPVRDRLQSLFDARVITDFDAVFHRKPSFSEAIAHLENFMLEFDESGIGQGFGFSVEPYEGIIPLWIQFAVICEAYLLQPDFHRSLAVFGQCP